MIPSPTWVETRAAVPVNPAALARPSFALWRDSLTLVAKCDSFRSFNLRQTLWGDLFAVDRYIAGGFNSDADLIAVDLHNRDNDVVTDDDLLAQLPAKNQHGDLPVDRLISNFVLARGKRILLLYLASRVPCPQEREH